MRFLAIAMLLGYAGIASAAGFGSCNGTEREGGSGFSPLKRAFFGDLHNHTSFSLDAYGFGTRSTPADAYAFATGADINIGMGADPRVDEVPGPFHVTIDFTGGRLDFAADTEHSETLGTAWGCTEDNGGPIYGDSYCDQLRHYNDDPNGVVPCAGSGPGATCYGVQTSAWGAVQQATEAANAPCHFTAFHGYEWSAVGNFDPDQTIHHNIIFRNHHVPDVPLDFAHYQTPTAMFAGLSQECTRANGCQAIAIPHNMNQSKGTMFDVAGYTATDLNRLLKYRRLVEVHQHKGNSECLVDRDDTGAVTACDFEVKPELATPQDAPGYARAGLKQGLEKFATRGYDTGKFGFEGSTDNHNGTPGNVAEATFPGFIGARDNTEDRRLNSQFIEDNPGGITGIWAEENTRDSLFDAMLRRETFATSGPRIAVRFYEYTGLAATPCADPSFPRAVVTGGGVPMGGTIPTPAVGVAPTFVVHVVHDATLLESIEIVKASAPGGVATESVYTIAEVGNPTKPLAGPPYCVTWTDPAFDPAEPAFWYARVKEQPTPRWSHYDCERLRNSGHPCACRTDDPDVPGPDCNLPDARDTAVVQERAWTSPIWHLPGGPVLVQTAKLAIRDRSALGNPKARAFAFKSDTKLSTAGHRITPPSPNDPGDPSAVGGVVTVHNGETGESWSSLLPAGGWSYNGTRWMFSDKTNPIKKVIVQADRITMKGGGEQFGFTLDEQTQGAISVRLRLGAAPPWCAEAGAKRAADGRTTANDLPGKFTAEPRAAHPDQCPVLASPSGAFVDAPEGCDPQ